jgi:hypothetical protein
MNSGADFDDINHTLESAEVLDLRVYSGRQTDGLSVRINTLYLGSRPAMGAPTDGKSPVSRPAGFRFNQVNG